MIKIQERLGIQGKNLNIDNYSSPQMERDSKAFSLKSGIRQRCPLSPNVLNIILKVSVGAIRQPKDIKEIKWERTKIKASLFAADMTLKLHQRNIYC